MLALVLSMSGVGGYSLKAQDKTVGVTLREENVEGFILFAPMSHKITYLIDRNGALINAWTSEWVPGLTAYLGEDGSLYRAGRVTDATHINSGGAGGVIERFNWNGELIWQFRYADRQVRQHHDFELMPNGNVLLIAWEEKTKVEAILEGRDPASMGADKLWPDHLVEIKPEGSSGGSIVWEWHVWDHLIQAFDSTKNNWGRVESHPELIDLNYYQTPTSDWIHANSIEYLPTLDQVMISSRTFNEIWIIDHSTTMVEAQGHQGGRYGRGGDLLYRWGNPQAYGRGDSLDQRFFGQHGLDWFQEDRVLVFNNGLQRPGGDHASIENLLLPGEQGHYKINDHLAFEPQESAWTFQADEADSLFAPLFSSVQFLSPDRMLLCLGPRGIFLEYNQSGNLLWKYVSPVLENGDILNQGETIGDRYSSNNSVFHVLHYPEDFPGFLGRQMNAGDNIEGEAVSTGTMEYAESFALYPNPTRDFFYFGEASAWPRRFEIMDVHGVRVMRGQTGQRIDISALPQGLYLVHIQGWKPQKLIILKD